MYINIDTGLFQICSIQYINVWNDNEFGLKLNNLKTVLFTFRIRKYEDIGFQE